MDTITQHTREHTTGGPFHSASRPLLEEVFGPVDAPAGTVERRVLLARSAVAYVGLVTTLVQVVVWLVIALMTNHLDSPWWLWTTVPAIAAVAALTLVGRWHHWWLSFAASQGRGR